MSRSRNNSVCKPCSARLVGYAETLSSATQLNFCQRCGHYRASNNRYFTVPKAFISTRHHPRINLVNDPKKIITDPSLLLGER